MTYSTTAAAAALTTIFAITAAGYVLLAVVPSARGAVRVSDVLHVVMSVAMLSMPWSWGADIAPPTLQIIVFSMATLYFLALLIGVQHLGGHGHHGSGPVRLGMLGYHVVMMGAMVVMGFMMRDMGHAASTDQSMPGMKMGSSATPEMQMSSEWRTTSWLLAVVFAIGTVAFLARLASLARRQAMASLSDAALLVLMSAGMALAFVPRQ